MSEKRSLSRAEQVRRRRAERTTKELEITTKRALKPIVPVTRRTPTIPMASVPKPAKDSRRFNIALHLPGFHFSKPKLTMPRFHFHVHTNWRYVSIGIVLVLGVLLYLAFTLPYFYIPAATVLGNNRLTREEVNAALGVSGESIFTVQPQELQTRLLMAYPELASAEVQVYLPNHVYVTVMERQPVLFWEQKDEGYTWVDAAGVAFRPRGLVTGLVPIVALHEPPAGIADDPLSPTPYVQKELVDAILALAPLVPDGSTLTFDSVHGLGWTDPRGWQAVFGTSAHDMPLKMRVYQSLVNSLLARGKTPEFISVKFVDAPYYRAFENQSEEETFVDSGQ
jgi:cell division protein FtsQ